MAITVAALRETAAGERRVAITPDMAKKMRGRGWQVLLEHGAGDAGHVLHRAAVVLAAAAAPLMMDVLPAAAADSPAAAAPAIATEATAPPAWRPA